MRALREVFPEAYIAYVCNGRAESVLRHNPHLDRVFVIEKDEYRSLYRRSKWAFIKAFGRQLQELRRCRFNYLVDLSLGDRYSLGALLMGIRKRVGFDFKGRGRFLTTRLPISGYHDNHVVEYLFKLLREVGIECTPGPLEFQLTDEESAQAAERLRQGGLDLKQKLVVLIPGGGASWGENAHIRRWSPERFAAVGDRLCEKGGRQLLLLGDSRDQPVTEAVERALKVPVLNLSGHTALREFAAILSHCELVVCNDGGPLHIAVSQGVKTVSLFGPVDDRVYGPYPKLEDRHRVVRMDLECQPCYHQFKMPPCPYELRCLRELSEDEVVNAAEDLLS
ncbi:MAG: glycosyltransferase family 9 protein [Candidatus Omnitrophica bacterium]|nr:glycosyltransferase family 9 protein [Candidatus Omnitrophota bacterium]